jgi:hypothetical protein
MQFLHPHIETNVYDLSDIVEIAEGGGTALFQPYFSDKGLDNKVELLTSLSDFFTKKGKPNFKKHGQAVYQVISWLQGGGRVFGMRLTAPNAYYSNSILNVKTKPIQTPSYQKDSDGKFLKDANNNRIPLLDTNGDPVLIPGVSVKLAVENIANLRNKSSFESQINGLPATDIDGFKNHRLLAFTAKGRGKYGDRYSYQLNLNITYEQDYNYRLYDFIMYEKDEFGNLQTMEQPYLVSTYPDAKNISNMLFGIKQILDGYSQVFDVIYNEDAYDLLLDDINEATKDINGDYTISDIFSVDFLFGRDKESELYEAIVIDPTGVDLSTYEGIFLAGGSDGLLDMSNSLAVRQLAMENALIDAYTGLTDVSILDKKLLPFDVTLDANFSVAVKNAMSVFTKSLRKDHIGILDTNVQMSAAATLAWRKTTFQENDRTNAIFGQFYTTYDAYTSRDITVTPTYDLAFRIPFSDARYGMHMPFVGPNRGILNNFKSLGWTPSVQEKEDLYKARVNYIEQDYKNARYMTQLTSQTKTSSLSDINNMRALFKMIRKVENIAENYYHEYPNSVTLGNMSSNINRELMEFTESGQCSSCSASVYQTAYDKDLKTVRIKLDVTFNSVIERIIFDVIVKR